MKDKNTAGLLALFFGGVGVHRFYLGQRGLGILYILFCWTLVPFLIGFVDALIFFLQSPKAFNVKYNADAFPSVGAGTARLSMQDLHQMQKEIKDS